MILFLIPCAICITLLMAMVPRMLRDAAHQKADNPTVEELNALLNCGSQKIGPEDQSDFVVFAEQWVRDQLAPR